MITVILSIISLAGLLFIMYPIFLNSQKNDIFPKETEGAKLKELTEHKKIIFQLLKDLEFEYKTGKISNSDFGKLQEEYKNKVFLIYQKIDQLIILTNNE